MYIKKVMISAESEPDISTLQETFRENQVDLNDRMRGAKGLSIASMFSLLIWVVVVLVVL